MITDKKAGLEISEYQRYLFHEGTNHHSYRMLGAHRQEIEGVDGIRFALWAPNAEWVSVVGDFNGWNTNDHLMHLIEGSGIWELFIPDIKEFDAYKFALKARDGNIYFKFDPYAYYGEVRPKSASKVYSLEGYEWHDEAWQTNKNQTPLYDKPVSIYEVHPGSWKRKDDNSFLTYRDLAIELVDYVVEMGYTHIELMPISEHPFDGSWGYQMLGYFAVTSRFGTPKDFMFFVDQCHLKGVGVILDWVPGHFPKDSHGLACFDGTCLYEHEDRRQGEHPQWGTLVFNFGRNEVRSFLISNALFWMDYFHIDGLRVDAVASMLYLDFGREEWLPNPYGGRENIEAIEFMKKLNEAVFREYPNTLMVAEESSAWPMVTKPTHLGGLGYNFKWNMGWMNDILKYIELDPIHRQWNHNLLTFSMMYAFSENFVIPLSHDEVVHGKRSLLDKMPGDYWQKFAGLRALYGYTTAHPGKKLLFMGGELGQFIEWKYDDSLDWHLLDYDMHGKIHNFVKDLNHMYLNNPSLWEEDFSWSGFEWIDPNDYQQSVISFIRKGRKEKDFLAVAINFTPVPRHGYRLGIPSADSYKELLNSDDLQYGGSGVGNKGEIAIEPVKWHKFDQSIIITIPPLSVVYLEPIFNN